MAAGYAMAVVLCLVSALAVLGITRGLYTAAVVVLSAGLLTVGTLPLRRWSAIDMILTAIVALDVASVFWSPVPASALNAACVQVMVWGVYVVMRRLTQWPGTVTVVTDGWLLVAVVASAMAIGTYAVCVVSARKVGFDDMYALRYLYKPLGNPNNCWGETALMMAAMACMSGRRWRWLAVYLASVSAMLTFSRGVYVAVVVLVVMCVAMVRPLRRCRDGLIAMAIAAVTVSVLFPSEVGTAVSMTSTQSQRASLQWRRDVTVSAVERSADRPLAGYGGGTFSLVTDNPAVDERYTDTAPGLAAQILVEKGAVGLALWTVLAVAVAVFVFRNRRRPVTAMAAAALTALMVKEMSQSIMVLSPAIGIPAVMMLAMMQVRGEPEPVDSMSRGSRVVGLMFAAVALLTVLPWTRSAVVGDTGGRLHRVFEHIADGRYGDAVAALDSISPACSDRRMGTLRAQVLLAVGDTCGLSELADTATAVGKWQSAVAEYRAGAVVEAGRLMSAALLQSPKLAGTADFAGMMARDSSFTACVLARVDSGIAVDTPVECALYGYLLYHTGRRDRAVGYLKSAVDDMPALRVPWLLLGDTARYDMLARGAVVPDAVVRTVPDTAMESVLDIVVEQYYPRAAAWYGF